MDGATFAPSYSNLRSVERRDASDGGDWTESRLLHWPDDKITKIYQQASAMKSSSSPYEVRAIDEGEEDTSSLTEAAMTAHAVVSGVRAAFRSGKTLPIEWRIGQLKAMQAMIEENQERFLNALHKDLRKPRSEGFSYELDFLVNEVRGCLRDIRHWTKPKPLRRQFKTILDTVYVQPEPYGVALIMGSWNYPVSLLLSPVCGAIAAGNCVVMKPSELAPTVAQVVEELVPKYFDRDCIKVYNGGIPETTELLKERFDYIFYTGSTNVGRIIHKAANKYLTPCTLELGGKSPVYVDDNADLSITAKRILWGKATNVGQTCIAPDYILCSKSKQDKLISEMRAIMKKWYGGTLQDSKDLARIVNERHFDRLLKILETTQATVAEGGNHDKSDLYIAPTFLTDVDTSDSCMQEEIFGPILPFVTINSAEEAVEFINAREKPLALYVFTENKKHKKMFAEKTSSGNLIFNDIIMHFAVESLPFGGVGESGMGAYHGDASFETFSHMKGVYGRDFSWFGEHAASIRYPPYSSQKDKLMAMAATNGRPIPPDYSGLLMYAGTFALGVAASAFGVISSIKSWVI